MKILKYDNSTSTFFNISRIDLTFVKPNDFSKEISENQIEYFYLNGDYSLQYDIFVFSSYGKERIKEYFIGNFEISENSKIYNFLFYSDKKISHYILKISNKETDNIFFNIKFFPKNTIKIDKEIMPNTIDNYMNQIQLPYPSSELYYLGRNEHYNYYLKNISGEYEASYLFLDDINNLEEVFLDKDNKMEPLIDNIMFKEGKSLVLMHFKPINNIQTLISLVTINSETEPGIYNNGLFYFYLKEKKNSEIIRHTFGPKNITIFAEYLGCQLEDNEEIRITFEDKILLELNKSINKGQFDIEINTSKSKYYAYSDKNCGVLFRYGKHELHINNTIEESYNNTMQEEIFYQYPKIEENSHYHFYFYYFNYGSVYTINPYCSFYYTDFNFLRHEEYINDYYDILMNPYNALTKIDNLTYLIHCYYYSIKPIYFNIIKLKQDEGILDKFFLTEKYAEYKFPKVTKSTQLLIQLHGSISYIKDDMPLLYIGNHVSELERYSANIIFVSNGSLPKILINGEEMALKVSYINNEVDLYSRINGINKGFNITSEESGIYKLSIKPLLYNENIQYIIHACTNYDILDVKKIFYYQRIMENFGDISINTTFVKNSGDVFDYTFNIKGKIDSSYEYFILVAKDIKTGYAEISGFRQCSYNYKNNNTNLIVILIPVLFVVIIVIIVIIYLIMRIKKNKNEFNIDDQGKLIE